MKSKIIKYNKLNKVGKIRLYVYSYWGIRDKVKLKFTVLSKKLLLINRYNGSSM